MYLYYQKLDGVTEFSLSSDGRTNFLNWKNKQDKATAEFIIHTLKQVPSNVRVMDDNTKIWSIIGGAAPVILAHLESFITQGILKRITIVEITDDLRARLERGNLSKPLVKAREEIKFKEEDFFYAPEGKNSELSGEEVLSKLATLLNQSEDILSNASDKELKGFYRKAALIYHPDRNNGDGSKMSELNMLWRLFNAGVQI